jgi:hypothetical protein
MELRKNLAISDTGFVFDSGNGESYSVNPVGLEIIRLLNEGVSDEELKTQMLEKYEVDSETFDLVYFDFIRSLQQFKLFQLS